MRHTYGQLSDLTAALNERILELGAPLLPADGTIASATAQLNALLSWAASDLDPADGTLTSAVQVYNAFVVLPGEYTEIGSMASGIALTWAGEAHEVARSSLPETPSPVGVQNAIQVAFDGIVPEGLFVHVNRDGSIALATKEEPQVWPEDVP